MVTAYVGSRAVPAVPLGGGEVGVDGVDGASCWWRRVGVWGRWGRWLAPCVTLQGCVRHGVDGMTCGGSWLAVEVADARRSVEVGLEVGLT